MFADDLFASRRVNGGFAMVDTNGVGGVTVYLENREVGKTDSSGRLFVPDLTPYYANGLRREAAEIPFEATVDTLDIVAVPFFRSGTLATFPVTLTRSITATLVDESGTPLPAGTVVRSADGTVVAPVARNGLVYLTDLGVGEIRLDAKYLGRECSFALNIPEELDLIPDFGAVECL